MRAAVIRRFFFFGAARGARETLHPDFRRHRRGTDARRSRRHVRPCPTTLLTAGDPEMPKKFAGNATVGRLRRSCFREPDHDPSRPDRSRCSRGLSPRFALCIGTTLVRPEFLAERCRSGRSGRSRKPLYVHAYRGFESHPLRHLPLRKRSPDPAPAGFFRCIRGLCGRGC